MKDQSSQNSTKADKPLGYRIGQGLRSAGEAVQDPGTLPGKAHGRLRRWFRKVWEVRGGGLYALGYIATFLWFEAKTLAGEISEAEGVVDFFQNQIAEFLVRFFTETITNMIKAFMWPVYIVQLYPPWGAIALGVSFALFASVLQKPIERYLFDNELRPETEAKKES